MAQQPEKRDGRLRREISEEELQRWHRMFYQSGLSLRAIGRLVDVNPRHLAQCFHQAGLPVARDVAQRYWRK